MEASSSRLSRLLNLVALLSETSTPVSAREIRARVDADYPEDDSLFRRQFERDKKELRELGIDLLVEEIGDTDPPELGYRVARDQYGAAPARPRRRRGGRPAAGRLARPPRRHRRRQRPAEARRRGWRPGRRRRARRPADPPAARAALQRRDRAAHGDLRLPRGRRVAPGRPVPARPGPRSLVPPRLRPRPRRRALVPARPHRGLAGARAGARLRASRRRTSPVRCPTRGCSATPSPSRRASLVDAAAAPLARSVAANAVVVAEADDGGLVLELPVSHPDGFRSFVLGLGEHAEVLEPAALRADIVALARVDRRCRRWRDGERRNSAVARLRRLLAMIPWLAANDGPKVADVCARFGITETELQRDLGLLSTYVGVPPYTPEALFDITIQRGRVFAHMTPALDRPLRLTPEEAVALVVAGRALADVPGADPKGPLARGLAKVADVLGDRPGPRRSRSTSAPRRRRRSAILREAVALAPPRRDRPLRRQPRRAASRASSIRGPSSTTPAPGTSSATTTCAASRARSASTASSAPACSTDRAARPPHGPLPVGFAAGRRRPACRARAGRGRPLGGRDLPGRGPSRCSTTAAVRATLAVAARPWLERLLLRLGPAVRGRRRPSPSSGGPAPKRRERVLARYRR